MDVSLNQVIEVGEKTAGDIGGDQDQSPDVIGNENDEEGQVMSESGNPSQPGSGFHYQIRNTSDNGQVTYRVVQVGGDDNNQQATLSIVTTNGIFNQLSQDDNGGGGSPQVAIVGNPFNNETGGDGTAGTTAAQADPALLSGAGQFYVMMSPQEMIQSGATTGERTILSRASFQAREDTSKGGRDDTRRVQHNEVERRRRDKINNWILKLANMIPDCANDHTKQGQSKGGILAKACEYINELQAANSQLSENLKDYESLQLDYQVCQRQLEDANQQIQLLSQKLQAHQLESPIQQTHQ